MRALLLRRRLQLTILQRPDRKVRSDPAGGSIRPWACYSTHRTLAPLYLATAAAVRLDASSNSRVLSLVVLSSAMRLASTLGRCGSGTGAVLAAGMGRWLRSGMAHKSIGAMMATRSQHGGAPRALVSASPHWRPDACAVSQQQGVTWLPLAASQPSASLCRTYCAAAQWSTHAGAGGVSACWPRLCHAQTALCGVARTMATVSEDEFRRRLGDVQEKVSACCLLRAARCDSHVRQCVDADSASSLAFAPMPNALQFAEAREELEEATASEETIYFDDDVQVAKECVVGE